MLGNKQYEEKQPQSITKDTDNSTGQQSNLSANNQGPMRLVGSFNLNNELAKLKRNIDALSSHTGKHIFGESWVQTLLMILRNPERENNLLREENRKHLEDLFVSYRLEKIAAANPILAREIFEDALLKSKLLYDNRHNSSTLEHIAKSHHDSAEFIFRRCDLREMLLQEMLLQGKTVSLGEFLERGLVRIPAFSGD